MTESLPQNRAELKDWCLRKLGQGVIKINVSEDQADDRIFEAIERFQEHHFDGVERFYLKRQITASVLKAAVMIPFTLIAGAKIVGQTSSSVGTVIKQATDNLSIDFTTDSGLFIAGETIIGPNAQTFVASSAADAVTLGDKDNGWIPVDDTIISIVQVVSSGGSIGGGLFSTGFQQALQFLPNFPSGGLAYFYQQKQHLALLEELFTGDKVMQFNRIQNRVTVNINWKSGIQVGEYLIFDAYKAINPESAKKIYRNYFVREYTTALLKKQWGQNLIKFDGVVLLNGATLNGQKIYDQAEKELEKLEERLRDEFQVPPTFFVG